MSAYMFFTLAKPKLLVAVAVISTWLVSEIGSTIFLLKSDVLPATFIWVFNKVKPKGAELVFEVHSEPRL